MQQVLSATANLSAPNFGARRCRDVREIYVQIGLEQPRAAERFFDSFERKTRLLLDQPRMGVRRPDIRPSLRMIVEAPFLMLYETVPDTDEGAVEIVRIVRVLDGRRDLRSLS